MKIVLKIFKARLLASAGLALTTVSDEVHRTFQKTRGMSANSAIEQIRFVLCALGLAVPESDPLASESAKWCSLWQSVLLVTDKTRLQLPLTRRSTLHNLKHNNYGVKRTLLLTYLSANRWAVGITTLAPPGTCLGLELIACSCQVRSLCIVLPQL